MLPLLKSSSETHDIDQIRKEYIHLYLFIKLADVLSRTTLVFSFIIFLFVLEAPPSGPAFRRIYPLLPSSLPCYRNSGALFTPIRNVSWQLVPENDETVDGNVLRLFLNDEAEPIHLPWESVRICLSGRRISFIGDSVTRYQYLNLVHFIAHGRWYSDYPSFEQEPLWSSWLDFYQGTTARLTTKDGVSRERCDCYRNPNDSLTRENRYFEDSELNLSISYIQFSVGISKRGMDYNKLDLSDCQEGLGCSQAECSPGSCSETHWFAKDHMDLLEHIASTIHPDTVVFNSGIWHRLYNPLDPGFTSPELIKDLIALAKRLPQFGIQRLIWKTTTAALEGGNNQLGAAEVDTLIQALEPNGGGTSWNVFDAYSITSSVFETGRRVNIPVSWDSIHFLPDVYRGLNEVLLTNILSGCKNCRRG